MDRPCPAQGMRRRDRVATASVRRVVLLAALVVLAAATLPDAAAAQQAATVDADVLNVRAEPGFWSPALGQAWYGQSVSVFQGPTPDGWYQIEAGGAVGWVHGWYLLFGGVLGWSAPTDAAPPPDPWTASAASVPSGVGGPIAPVPDAGGASPATQPQPLDGWTAPLPLERWVDVNRTTQTVTLYEGGAPVAGYWGAMGVDRSDAGFFATAVGTYYVYEKYADLSYTIWGQSWVRNWVGFDPHRLNGFHGYSMDWSGRVLPGGAGPTGGCVALDPWAAEQLFNFVQLGTRVEVHW